MVITTTSTSIRSGTIIIITTDISKRHNCIPTLFDIFGSPKKWRGVGIIAKSTHYTYVNLFSLFIYVFVYLCIYSVYLFNDRIFNACLFKFYTPEN